jgi:glutamate--cysteine ligase
MRGICELLDGSDPQRPYCTALAAQQAKITEPELTPAARMLTELLRDGESFFDLGAAHVPAAPVLFPRAVFAE